MWNRREHPTGDDPRDGTEQTAKVCDPASIAAAFTIDNSLEQVLQMANGVPAVTVSDRSRPRPASFVATFCAARLSLIRFGVAISDAYDWLSFSSHSDLTCFSVGRGRRSGAVARGVSRLFRKQ